MDFVKGLPCINGKTILLTVVGCFSKVTHLIPLSHSYTATTVVRTFFDVMVWLYGITSSIIFDRDPVFTSIFWHESFSLAMLNLSSAFNP
jgi:hypothetical protein